MNASPCLRAAALGAAFCLLPIGAHAQSAPAGDRWAFDGRLGALLSIPDELEADRCGGYFAFEAAGGVSATVSERWAVESSVSVGLPRPITCVVDPLPPPDNGSVTRRIFDGTDEDLFVSSTHRVVLDLAPSRRSGPRVSLGGGRIWSHGLWFWSAGVGLRLGSGRPGRVVEVERMQVRLRFVEETRVYSGGQLVDSSTSARMTQGGSMWSVRFRLPVG
jgi:hypothetical protein